MSGRGTELADDAFKEGNHKNGGSVAMPNAADRFRSWIERVRVACFEAPGNSLSPVNTEPYGIFGWVSFYSNRASIPGGKHQLELRLATAAGTKRGQIPITRVMTALVLCRRKCSRPGNFVSEIYWSNRPVTTNFRTKQRILRNIRV